MTHVFPALPLQCETDVLVWRKRVFVQLAHAELVFFLWRSVALRGQHGCDAGSTAFTISPDHSLVSVRCLEWPFLCFPGGFSGTVFAPLQERLVNLYEAPWI